jgi:hypothetical protein
MRTVLLVLLVCSLVLGASLSVQAQRSDFAIKQGFEETYKSLSKSVETAVNVAELDSLKTAIDSCEARYSRHEKLLDRVLYPETFASKMKALRTTHALTYDRVYLITTQGVKLEELEMRILYLTNRIDTLSADRDRLAAELKTLQRSSTEYREVIRRLQANLAAKDRLIFALVDTVFQPYGKDLSKAGDIQRESLTRQMEKANILNRVEGVATDNVGFLQTTTLQPKDYASAVDQYQLFSNRWQGLREKLIAASVAGTSTAPEGAPVRTKGKESGVTATGPPRESPAARVDSILGQWGERLQLAFWRGLEKEFADRGVTVEPFHDAAGFSSSIKTYVAKVQKTGEDPSVFVNDIWKTRIDKEWREALVKPAMLGAQEYATLDKLVGELSRPTIDAKMILYAVILVVLVALIWWFFSRKPKSPPPPVKGN